MGRDFVAADVLNLEVDLLYFDTPSPSGRESYQRRHGIDPLAADLALIWICSKLLSV